jgi:hypothetical protein
MGDWLGECTPLSLQGLGGSGEGGERGGSLLLTGWNAGSVFCLRFFSMMAQVLVPRMVSRTCSWMSIICFIVCGDRFENSANCRRFMAPPSSARFSIFSISGFSMCALP